MDDRMRQIERQLYRRMRTTCEEHALLAPGDRIMIAISGGKDSYTLTDLLHRLVARLPFEVALKVVHLDQRQPGYDGTRLVGWLEQRGYAFEILSEDTYSVVTSTLDEGATYCSLCSRLRRGILYTAAERLGCNKIALGHHRDDGLETFLLNLFFAGKLQAMPASYTTNDNRFQVIRPLIACPEALIREYAALAEYPILPCNLCGSQPNLERDAMMRLIDSLEERHPDVRAVMAAALANVVPTHLLDPSLQRKDEPRSSVPPTPPRTTDGSPKPRASALPILSSSSSPSSAVSTPAPHSSSPRRLPLIN